MNLCQTGQSENQERVINPTCGFAILISDKECQQTSYEPQGDDASLQGREEKAGHTGEDDKCRRDGPAINADEGVEIVEQDHQVGGQDETCQLDPPLMLNRADDETDAQTIEDRHR